ncbi:MAG: hypothetical protein WAM39_06825, partial [Bryobacteraceae bacterium]
MSAASISTAHAGPQTTQSHTSPGAPTRYSGFDGQYINGSWRPGKQGEKEIDTDPYSGETLAEIVMANRSDLDEAYQSAAKAQIGW